MAAHSPLSATLAEEAGFDGAWASGFELSALLGARSVHDVVDVGIVQLRGPAEPLSAHSAKDGHAHGAMSPLRRVITLMRPELPELWTIVAFSAITGAREDTYVHNIFIEVLCELGIPMFALLVVLLYLTIVRGRRLFIDASPDPALRATVATLLALTAYDLLIAQKEGGR